MTTKGSLQIEEYVFSAPDLQLVLSNKNDHLEALVIDLGTGCCYIKLEDGFREFDYSFLYAKNYEDESRGLTSLYVDRKKTKIDKYSINVLEDETLLTYEEKQ